MRVLGIDPGYMRLLTMELLKRAKIIRLSTMVLSKRQKRTRCLCTFEYTTIQIKHALTGNCHAEKTVAIYGQKYFSA